MNVWRIKYWAEGSSVNWYKGDGYKVKDFTSRGEAIDKLTGIYSFKYDYDGQNSIAYVAAEKEFEKGRDAEALRRVNAIRDAADLLENKEDRLKFYAHAQIVRREFISGIKIDLVKEVSKSGRFNDGIVNWMIEEVETDCALVTEGTVSDD
jgi:hypothetical protein